MMLYNVREIDIYDTNVFVVQDTIIVHYVMLRLLLIIVGIIMVASFCKQFRGFWMEILINYNG